MKAKAAQGTLDFEARKPLEERGIWDAVALAGEHYGEPLLQSFGAAIGRGDSIRALASELRKLDERGIELAPAVADFAKQIISRFTGAEAGFRLHGESPAADVPRDQLWGAFASALQRQLNPPIASMGVKIGNLLPGFFSGLKAAAESSDALGGPAWETVLDVAFKEIDKERNRRDPERRATPWLHGGEWNAALEAVAAVVEALGPAEQKERWAQRLPTATRQRILGG